MRLFFALLPNNDDAARIFEASQVAEALGAPSWVPPANYHVTLAFVGEVADSALAALCQIGSEQRVRQYEVRLDRTEFWPSPAVLVATCKDFSPRLKHLSESLQTAVAGVRRQLSSELLWRLHVTLARNVLQAPQLQAMSPICWNADSFSLMSSERRGSRSVYTVVDTWPLLDSEPKL